MRASILTVTLLLIPSVAFSADCQNLEGRYFFADQPVRSVVIEQSECALTMTNLSAGQAGKPIRYNGDGTWNTVDEGEYIRETASSTAYTDRHLIENKFQRKRTNQVTHVIKTLRLRDNGDVLVHILVDDGQTQQTANQLWVRTIE